MRGAASLRPAAIVLTTLMLAAIATWLLLGRHAGPTADADPAPAIRVVDALTGRPVPSASEANDSAVAAAPIPIATRHGDLVQALAARGGADMPMLAEMVTIQPRVAGDGAAEARAAQLLSRHLRLAPSGHPLQVRCAAALCEVTGTIAAPAAAIEAPALLEAVLAAGWTPGPVTSAPAAGGATDFLMYLNRESLKGEGR